MNLDSWFLFIYVAWVTSLDPGIFQDKINIGLVQMFLSIKYKRSLFAEQIIFISVRNWTPFLFIGQYYIFSLFFLLDNHDMGC